MKNIFRRSAATAPTTASARKRRTRVVQNEGKSSMRLLIATFAVLLAGASGIFLYTKFAQAATFTFTQSSWAGGVTANTATNTANQTGWTQAGAAGDVTLGTTVALSPVTKSFTDDGTTSTTSSLTTPTGGGFSNGTNSATVTGGSGSGGAVALPALSTGGAITTSGGNTIHTFTSSGTFVSNTVSVNTLVLGAGGGGGGLSSGGGAGGLVLNPTESVVAGTSYPITVASATATNSTGPTGGNSTFNDIVAYGGGGGVLNGNVGRSGGSGGAGGNAAGGSATQPTSGTNGIGGTGYGNAGATTSGSTGGGGGGAGSAGTTSAGGAGLASSISGVSVTYAAGGAKTGAAAGAANTGNGGGGTTSSNPGGAGGSGIVIISYPTPTETSGTFTSAVIDFKAAAAFSTLSFNKTTPVNSTITIDAHAGNTASPDASWTGWITNITSGGSIASLSGNRYVQYRANFAKTDAAVVPQLFDVTINSGNWVFVDDGTITVTSAATASGGGIVLPSGGTITTAGGYRIHTFTSSGTFNPSAVTSVEYLVVAGGGGGGGMYAGAGGGGGGFLTNTGYTVTPWTPVTVTIGAGGGGGGANVASNNGANGGNSVFGTITATGGGGGGAYSSAGSNANGQNGGSGGGATQVTSGGTFGTGVTGQGHNGGTGTAATNYGAGGGGGAGAVGGNGTTTLGGNGGAGLSSAISGSTVWYAGGGGGAVYSGTTAGTGGIGGGSDGSIATASAATPNTGGGGGGSERGGTGTHVGGAGGSGIVIVRYPLDSSASPSASGTTVTGSGTSASIALTNTQSSTGGTITTSGANTINTFTSSGTFTPATSGNVNVLVVAGGGGGGGASAGGGGGGGFVEQTGRSVTGSTAYTVTVGAPGTAGTNAVRGGVGGNSVFDTITALGGGGGASGNGTNTGINGGSGGGGGTAGGSATQTDSGGGTGYGFAGGYGAGGSGGGGAGGVGANYVSGYNTAGGVGRASSISGASVTYSTGGVGHSNGAMDAPPANSGNGGKGNFYGAAAGPGAAGVVIVSYPTYVYSTSGTFTSAAIDLGAPAIFTTLDYTSTVPANTTLTMDVRGSLDNVTWSAYTTGVANGGSISALTGNRYVQYRANFATTDTAATATLSAVTFNYSQYPLVGWFTSSIFDSESAGNAIGKLTWTATGTSSTAALKFQVRSSPDGTTWSNWCGASVTCDGTDYLLDADNGATLASGHPLTTGGNDRYFQYAAYLSSTGVETPSLTSVAATYVVNGPPDFDATYGTNGVSVTQVSDTADANLGKVTIGYRVRDIDTSGASVGHVGFITPSFEYSLNNGSTWTAIPSGDFVAGNTDPQTVNTDDVTYTTHTAVWIATSTLPTTYNTTMKIRVTANDLEGSNNTATAVSGTFTLDSPAPVVSAIVDSTTGTTAVANIILTSSDDSLFQYRICNDSTYPGTTDAQGNSCGWSILRNNMASTSIQWVPTGAPAAETVYLDVRDAVGNMTHKTLVAPATPHNFGYSDVSNTAIGVYREFLSWGIADIPTFGSYRIYSSVDNGSTWSLLNSITDPTLNYYADTITNVPDQTLRHDYRVITVSNNGDLSNYSVTMSDVPDGTGSGGLDVTYPGITNVATTSITSTSGTITFTTDELALATVLYGTTDYTASCSSFSSTKNGEGYALAQSVTLTGLSASTRYYFCVRATDIAGNLSASTPGTLGGSFVTSAAPAAPIITNVATSSLVTTGVTITWTTDINSDSYVNYSTSASLTSPTTVGSAALTTSHSVTLGGLTSGQSYYFDVKSTDVSGNTTTDANSGSHYNVVTPTTSAPVLSGISTTAITPTTASVIFTTNMLATSTVLYGTTDLRGDCSFTSRKSTTGYDTDQNVPLTGLTANTTYYFCVQSKNVAGTTSTAETGGTFTTTRGPVITSVATSSLTTSGVVITWTTGTAADSYVDYSTSASLTLPTTVGTGALATSHSVTLTGLTSLQNYYFQVKSTDASSQLTTDTNSGSYYTFTTGGDPTAPTGGGFSNATNSNTTVSGAGTAASVVMTAPSLAGADGTGGTITHSGGRTIHTFTSSGTFTPPASVSSANVLVIAGGGGGGASGNSRAGGGGGGGGMVEQTGRAVTAGTPYAVTVGAGGAGASSSGSAVGAVGSNSVFDAITANGGGSGGVATVAGGTGGSGGGGGYDAPAAAGGAGGAANQIDSGGGTGYGYNGAAGYSGSVGGGGGSAGSAGSAGTGGSGRSNSITGSSVIYAAGGAGSGGASGGANTGKGGAGNSSGFGTVTAGTGGSGVVIVSYATSFAATFTSAVIDYKAAKNFSTVLFTNSAPANTSLTLDVRAGNSPSYDGTWTTVSGLSPGGDISALNGNRYVQYIAHFANTDGASTATLYDVTINSTDWQFMDDGTTTVTAQLSAPVASSIGTANVTATTASVIFTTDLLATSTVMYGTTDYRASCASFTSSVSTSGYTFSQSIPITGLTAATPYYFCVKASNTAGTVSTPVSGGTFTTSGAPADVAPVISDISTTAITPTTASVIFTTDKLATSTVMYGTTDYRASCASFTSSTSTSVNHTAQNVPLTGLTANTTYYFCVKAMDVAGTTSTAESGGTFTTAQGPVITSVATSSLTSTGVIVTWTTGTAADSYVYYSTSADLSNSVSIGSPALVTSHSVALTGLNAQTSYYFEVRSTDAAAHTTTDTNSSNYYNFVTLATSAPIISGISSTAITPTTASIIFTTDILATSTVLYGTTDLRSDCSFTSSATTAGYTTDQNVPLTGLSINTTYYYCVKSTSIAGATSATTVGGTFTTTRGPIITLVATSSLTTSAVTITWTTNTSSDSYVGYSTSPSFTTPVIVGSAALATSHSVTLVGLTSGQSYYFEVMSKDSTNQTTTDTNSSNYYNVDIPLAVPPVISSISTTAITPTTASIIFTTDMLATSTVLYGTTDLRSDCSFASTKSTTGYDTAQNVPLTGLTANTAYYFCVKATNVAGTTSTAQSGGTFTTTRGPVITSVATSSLTTTGVTITWTTGTVADSHVDYSTSAAMTTVTTVGSATLTTSHAVALTGLTPGQSYYFDVKSTDAVGQTTTDTNSGNYYNVDAPSVVAPVVSAISTAAITPTTASVLFTTDVIATSTVLYGTTDLRSDCSFASTKSTTGYDTAQNVPLTGLTANTAYYFCVKATNVAGTTSTAETGGTFTTTRGPVITSVATSSLTTTGVTITWTTGTAADSYVRYATSTAFWSPVSVGSPTLEMSHSVALTGLTADTSYYFEVRSTDAASQITVDTNSSNYYNVATPAVVPPVITNILVPGTTLLSTSALVTFTTDKIATSTVLYGTTASQSCAYATSVSTTAYATAQSLSLTGLTPNTTYYFCVQATDVTGATSAAVTDLSFATTPGAAISNVTAGNLTDTSVSISWQTATSSDSFVFYSTSTTSPGILVNPIKVGTVTLASEITPGVFQHQVDITGLTAAQSYAYSVQSTDSAGNVTEDTNSGNFYTIPSLRDSTPPVISNISAPVKAVDAAAIVWKTDEAATSQVYYGTSSGTYPNLTALDTTKSIWHVMALSSGTLNAANGATDVAVSNNRLATSTPYYFIVVSADASGNIATSTESTFTSGAITSDVTPPIISSILVPDGNLKTTTARVTFTTDEIATSTVQYRISGTNTWSEVAETSFGLAHSVDLSGLTPQSTYNIQIKASDVPGNESAYSAGSDFVTKGGPVITAVTTSSIVDTGATISWTTDVSSDSYVYYSHSASLDNALTAGSAVMVTQTSPGVFNHEIILSNLSGFTQYYYKVVSTNVDGNSTSDTNGGSYYTFTTAADATKPVISAISVPVMASDEAVVVWKTDENATSQVLYSTTSGVYPKFSVTDLTKSIYHVVTLSPETTNAGTAGGVNTLAPETTYYYVVKSADTAGNMAISDEQSFTTPASGAITIVVSVVNRVVNGTSNAELPTPDTTGPVISDIKATNIDAFGALVTFNTDENSVGFVDYGKTTTYGDNVGDPVLARAHSVKIHGLTMGTDYHFRVKAIDKEGNLSTSDDQTFKTIFISEQEANNGTSTLNGAPIDTTALLQSQIEDLVQAALPSLSAPFITVPIVTAVTEHSATVTWNTNVKSYGLLGYATDDDFKAKTGVYTLDVSAGADRETLHSVDLVNLKSNTTYHIQATGYVFQQVIGKSADVTFTTKPSQIVGTIAGRTKDSFTVAWTTDEPASSIVEYKNTSTGIIGKSTNEAMATAHAVKVENLPSGTTYTVNISGINAQGNTLEAAKPITVTVPRDLIPPVISGFKVDNALVPGRTDRIQTVVTWKTDKPSDSTVYYEEGAGTPGDTKELANKVAVIDSFVLAHSVILANLKPGVIYRIKIVSVDDSDNKASFGPRTIITPQQTQSITDIIFKNFEDSFKFLRQI